MKIINNHCTFIGFLLIILFSFKTTSAIQVIKTQENEKLTLECNTKISSNETMIQKYNETSNNYDILVHGLKLDINKVELKDSGTYVCTFENHIVDTIFLNVGKESHLEVRLQNTELYLSQYSVGVIDCIVDFDQEYKSNLINADWYDNNNKLIEYSNNGNKFSTESHIHDDRRIQLTLHINYPSLSDTGTYTCLASDGYRSKNGSINVFVNERYNQNHSVINLEMPITQTYVEVIEASRLEINCEIPLNDSLNEYRMYFINKKSNQRGEVGTLYGSRINYVVDSVRVSDAGIYECYGYRSDALSTYSRINVDVKEDCKPYQIRCRNNACISAHFVCDGHNHCEDSSDEENCPESNDALCRSNQFECKNFEKCISKAKLCDHNDDCSDRSDEDNCFAPYNTGITIPLLLNSTIPEGSSIKLTCISNGFPVPYITWNLNNGHVCEKPRCETKSENGESVLIIKNYTRSDYGIYKCLAQNSIGRIELNPNLVLDRENNIDDSLNKINVLTNNHMDMDDISDHSLIEENLNKISETIESTATASENLVGMKNKNSDYEQPESNSQYGS